LDELKKHPLTAVCDNQPAGWQVAWLGFFLEFTLKIQKGVLYLVSIVTNIATVTIGGTLAEILTQPFKEKSIYLII